MQTIEMQPHIPDESLLNLWDEDEQLQAAHENLASQRLEEFWSRMPLLTTPYGDRKAAYADMRHEDDPGGDHAIVIPLPYANGWAPHMAMRAKLLQDSLDVPHRIIVFPNNTKAEKVYHLSQEELETVSAGNFDPIAEKQLDVLNRLRIESIQFAGYSQGATIGAVALNLAAKKDRFELGASGLFEPPNMIARNEKELSKAFTSDGIKPLNRAVNDSGIPALSEAQHSRGGMDTIRQLAGFALFGLGTLGRENKAIKRGFTHGRFMRTMGQVPQALPILLAGARHSKIANIQEIERLETTNEGHALKAKVIEGYGHEMGDNIVLLTVLSKLALKAA